MHGQVRHDRHVNDTRDTGEFAPLVGKLTRLPHETEWVEFKENNADPDLIGEYISALANSAALNGQHWAYMLWGVRDSDHSIVGTKFDPQSAKVGNEDLENWLLRLLSPQLNFKFRKDEKNSLNMVILEIEAATHRPIQFKGIEYVRVGSYKKKLKDHHERARRLWRLFETSSFEGGVAVSHLREDEVTRLLDYPSYFDLMRLPLPENRAGIIEALAADRLITDSEGVGWAVTNLGALLFARNLNDFASLKRKATRVIQYKNTNRVETRREQVGERGYAAGFSGLIGYIDGLLPDNEIIGEALRSSTAVFPKLAIRELVANALIHQDLAIPGTGPMVEIFPDRMEITNPGIPLIEASRFIDSPPRSRNETLAAMMRRIGICEERGSGWDKVTFEVEYHQLPAPLIEVTESHTRTVLFAPRSLTKMDKADRIRATYQHACLRYVNRENMTNATVRLRFGIEDHNKAAASRLIREAVEGGAIAPYDPDAGARALRYVPYWATG